MIDKKARFGIITDTKVQEVDTLLGAPFKCEMFKEPVYVKTVNDKLAVYLYKKDKNKGFRPHSISSSHTVESFYCGNTEIKIPYEKNLLSSNRHPFLHIRDIQTYNPESPYLIRHNQPSITPLGISRETAALTVNAPNLRKGYNDVIKGIITDKGYISFSRKGRITDSDVLL